ncbi:MAG: STAS domain-containing protein [Gammaproteobacteria bacterium]|nr:STAS domain-containing protein [Gammaproteobacteria bacterium]
MDIGTVPSILDLGAGMFTDSAVVVDLKAVARIDSAGLALLVNWAREGRRHRVAIRFQNIPARMLAIAKICGVDKVLPAEAFSETELCGRDSVRIVAT